MNESRPLTDDARVRRLFSATSSESSFIATEVAARMAERLDYVRIDALQVVDSHSQPPGNWQALRTRFPDAQLTTVHLAPAQLPGAAPASRGWGLSRWLDPKRNPGRVCADLSAMPLRPGSVDVIWSNLALHWQAEPHRVFPQWSSALRSGGLVLFSAFGPDSLREIVAAFRNVDDYPHVIPFTDMHDFGDMLVDSGFATPVMDMENITLTYASHAKLWDDVRALGGNPLRGRRRGLLSRAQGLRLTAALDALRAPDGQLKLTFEVVYGHAWKAEPRTVADGRTILRRIDRSPTS